MTTAAPPGIRGVLLKTGMLNQEQVLNLLERGSAHGGSILGAAVDEGYAEERPFLKSIAETLGMPFVMLSDVQIEQDVLDLLPTRAVFQHEVIPVRMEDNILIVATSDPFNTAIVDSIRLASGRRVKLALSPRDEIAKAAKRFYGVGAETVDALMQDERIDLDAERDSLAKVDLNEQDEEASIVKFVNQVIWEAHKEKATDIHFEPMETSLRIRYRVDGVLVATPLPAQLSRFQAAIISRIKVMANMDIAEKRLPQDGRIGLRIQGQDIDIRVSTMPTVYGESMSLRLLSRGGDLISLSDLGMSDRDAEVIMRIIHKPNGIVLVTGPTGSGKSTSLYAYLHEINSTDVRILTVEDPIEYEMAGINQVHVRDEIGLTFAHALRTFLRQDPDVIMVGEIRDFDTAETAIRAALTGHLVFSTLHTNDAAGAVTRLVDMGVEPFLVASSLQAIVAQRLVRRLCFDCRVEGRHDDAYLSSVDFPTGPEINGVVYEASGCESCRSTGYRGRTGIYEILEVTETIEPHIVARDSASVIKGAALREGMRTLRDDGWDKVLKGRTTIDEVLRVAEEDER
ncbi:MAG: GspE/PulE family protein [Verrucomicrobia bacterium]|nr:GspE/PulE family protein [Verrucomicrobiota bacterium]MDA1087829.1 GspE/PulE family protein [Verrucomicrobiota bacterium]